MQKKSTWKARLPAVALAAILLAGSAFGGTALQAVFDPEQAIHIDPDHVEDATLLIGTHLIYLGSLTDELYEIASTSASASGQGKTFYKSELADGAWYEIDGASSLADIKKGADQVAKQVIAGLDLTHHTKSDGITYDLRTNQAVEVYDIISPYDMVSIPELEPLANEYASMEQGIGGADKAGNIPELKAFFETDLTTDETERYDERLKKVSAFQKVQKEKRADNGRLDVLSRIEKKLDDSRRLLVCQSVAGKLEDLEKKLSGAEGSSELLEAITKCRINVEESSSGAEDETVMGTVEAELLQAFLEGLEKEDVEKSEETLSYLSCLYHLMDGISLDPQEEIKFLEEIFIPRAEKAYEEDPTEVRRGELEFYEKAKAQLAGGEETISEELASCITQKELVKEAYLAALDAEDLEEAARLEAELDEWDRQIEKLGGDPQTAPDIREKKEEALQIIEKKQEDLTTLEADVEALGALLDVWPELSGEALKEVYQKMAAVKYMEETARYDALMERTETLFSENMAVLSGKTDVEAAVETTVEAAGSGLDGGNPQADAAGLMGLALFNEQAGSDDLAELIDGKAEELASAKDSRVFEIDAQAALRGTSYAPADKVAACAGLRYVWKSGQKQAVLAKGGRRYSFQAFSGRVVREGEKEEEMGASVLFQKVLYLPGAYVEKEFELEIYEISGTACAVLVDKKTKEAAAGVCDALTAR